MFSQGRLCWRAVGGNVSKLTTVTTKSAPQVQNLTHSLGAPSAALSIIQLRFFNSVKYNSKLEYYSASEDVRLPRKITEFKHALEGHTRPLTLLLTWLMAKDKHIKKYVKFYNDLGIDVLNIKFSPLDIVSPAIHGQRVVNQFLHFLHHYPETCPVLLHGFSVGGYLCATAMVEVEKDFEKHGHLLDRFVGQIWDSVVDVGGMPIGVARSVTDLKFLQDYIQSALEWYLKVRYDSATVYYERASVQFHKNYMGTPGLFFVSTSDPISPPKMVMGAHDDWKKLGFNVHARSFENTKHVSHRMVFKKDYDNEVLTFLKNIGLTVPVVAPAVLKRDEPVPVQAKRVKREHRTPAPAPVLTLTR